MIHPDEKTFTSGEFAKLLGISKQAISLYERENIITPEYIGDNNYHYYSLSQYRILEIVTQLRKLNFSIKEIKDYLNHRDIEFLKKILSKKISSYQHDIFILNTYTTTLTNYFSYMEYMGNIITNQVFLEQQPKFYYIKSTEILPNIPSHEKIRARINFLKKANLTAFIINRGGWIIPQDAFKPDNKPTVIHYLAILDDSAITSNGILSPSQMYCSIAVNSNFHKDKASIIHKLLNFIQLNNLEIIGDIFILSIKNHWHTKDKNEYILKINVPVKNK